MSQGQATINKPIVYIVHAVDVEGPMTETIQATFERLRSYGLPTNIKTSRENLNKIQNGTSRSIDDELLAKLKIIFSKHSLDYYNDWNKYFEEREKNNYNMFLNTWRSDFVGDPYFFLYDLFHSQSVNNIFHYKNTSVDSLLNLARITDSRENRNEYYKELLKIIENDVPAVYILHPKEVFVINKRFSPVIIDPYGYIHYEKIRTY